MKSKLIAIRSTGEGFRDVHLETEEMVQTFLRSKNSISV